MFKIEGYFVLELFPYLTCFKLNYVRYNFDDYFVSEFNENIGSLIKL